MDPPCFARLAPCPEQQHPLRPGALRALIVAGPPEHSPRHGRLRVLHLRFALAGVDPDHRAPGRQPRLPVAPPAAGGRADDAGRLRHAARADEPRREPHAGPRNGEGRQPRSQPYAQHHHLAWRHPSHRREPMELQRRHPAPRVVAAPARRERVDVAPSVCGGRGGRAAAMRVYPARSSNHDWPLSALLRTPRNNLQPAPYACAAGVVYPYQLPPHTHSHTHTHGR